VNKTYVLGYLILATGAVAGCQSTKLSAYQFDEYRVAVSASAESRRAEIKRCVDEFYDDRGPAASGDRFLATIMGVSMADYPRAFCQRFIDGVASGRISYNDYMKP
jgi:hypothetical protein